MTLWDQNRPVTQRLPLEVARCLPYILGPDLERETPPPVFVRAGSHPFLRCQIRSAAVRALRPLRARRSALSPGTLRVGTAVARVLVGRGGGEQLPPGTVRGATNRPVARPRPISAGIRRRARTNPPGREPLQPLVPRDSYVQGPALRAHLGCAPDPRVPHLPCHLRPIRRGSRSPDEAQLIHTSPVPPARLAHPGHRAPARLAVNLECDTGPPARFLGPSAYESPSKGPWPRRRAPSRDPWRMNSGAPVIQRVGPWMYASQTSGALVHPREGGTPDVWFAPCARLTSLCRAPNLPPAASPTHSTIGLPRRLTLSPSSGGGTRWLTRSAI
jgi:hypothetical protein